MTLDPSIVEAHANLGLLRASQGRIDEAVSHLENAREAALASGQERIAEEIGARVAQLRGHRSAR